MEQNVLTASGLTMRYHSTLALDNLDMNLPQGKIVGLLGPNGSGKTTFIKLAAGLLTPTAGQITVCGEKIGTATKAMVSYLPDRPYFSRQVRVEQQLDFFQDFYADFDRTRAEEMLSALNISLSAKFKSLSKGVTPSGSVQRPQWRWATFSESRHSGAQAPWSGWLRPSQSRPCSCPGLSNPSFYLSLSRTKIYPLLPCPRRFKPAVGVDRDVGEARRF